MMKYIKLKKHEKYIDARLPTMCKLPATWQVEKAKWLYKKEERPIRGDDEIVTCFRDGQVTLRKNRRTEGFTNALHEHGYQGIRNGDLVIHAMDAFAGAIGVSDSDGKSTPVYSVCTPRKPERVNSFFYAYYLRNLAATGFIETLAKGIRERSTDFRFRDFSELILPLPPFIEQAVIARFLDEKTARIDEAIAKKEKMIALLNERKQIIIQNAVTKGLAPTVKMKDSGIEWIGQIPEHWTLKPIKHLKANEKNSFVDGPFGSNLKSEHFVENGDVYVIESGFITTGMFVHKEFKTITKKHFETIKRSSCKGNDIIIAKIGANYGMAAELPFLDKESVVSGNSLKITLNNGIMLNSLFVKLLGLAKSLGGFESIVNASAQPALSLGGLNNLKLPVAGTIEQQAIVDFFENRAQRIDATILRQVNLIEKLKEYKAVLIDSAVTGKIKVI